MLMTSAEYVLQDALKCGGFGCFSPFPSKFAPSLSVLQLFLYSVFHKCDDT